MIIAHRGVSFKFPENSLPAFEAWVLQAGKAVLETGDWLEAWIAL